MSDFLLVIPAFREHLRLPPFLNELVSTLCGAPFTTKIQIVDDDGSPPRSSRLCFSPSPPESSTSAPCSPCPSASPANHGKGETILTGWRDAGDSAWLALLSMRTVPSRLPRCAGFFPQPSRARAQPENSCFFASRILMCWDARSKGAFYATSADASSPRVVAEEIFSRLTFTDSQCGFKVLPRACFSSGRSPASGGGPLLRHRAFGRVAAIRKPPLSRCRSIGKTSRAVRSAC